MKYGLNDDVVKRIAAIAFHSKEDAVKGTSRLYNNIFNPDVHAEIFNAQNLDAMNNMFKDKEEENKFKTYLAKSSAINRGTLEAVVEKIATPKASRGKKG